VQHLPPASLAGSGGMREARWGLELRAAPHQGGRNTSRCPDAAAAVAEQGRRARGVGKGAWWM
jgi:hypothetical protein